MPEQTGKIWKRLGTSGKDWERLEKTGKSLEKPGWDLENIWSAPGKPLCYALSTLYLHFIYAWRRLAEDWRESGGDWGFKVSGSRFQVPGFKFKVPSSRFQSQPPMLNVEVTRGTSSHGNKSPNHQIANGLRGARWNVPTKNPF